MPMEHVSVLWRLAMADVSTMLQLVVVIVKPDCTMMFRFQDVLNADKINTITKLTKNANIAQLISQSYTTDFVLTAQLTQSITRQFNDVWPALIISFTQLRPRAVPVQLISLTLKVVIDALLVYLPDIGVEILAYHALRINYLMSKREYVSALHIFLMKPRLEAAFLVQQALSGIQPHKLVSDAQRPSFSTTRLKSACAHLICQ